MGDFLLSDALEGSSELSETTTVQEVQGDTLQLEDTFQLEDGLNLTVSRNRMTMQRVARLVMTVNRMSAAPRPGGRRLSADELCSAIMDNLVEETFMQTVVSASGSGERRRVTFQRVNSVKEFRLCDASKKDLVHLTGEFRLQAITLKGGHFQRHVNFKMSRYVTACVAPGDGQTVVLSLAEHLHLSCLEKDDTVSLNVEECCWDALQWISGDGDMDRFLFWRRTAGVSLTTFESVKHRGWFISTASDGENQPVEMCRVDAACRLTSFQIN